MSYSSWAGARKGSRQPGGETRTLARFFEGLPGGRCVGGLACDSFAPVVTVPARCSPLPARLCVYPPCTACSGPVRSRAPPALRSSRPGPIGRPGMARPMQASSDQHRVTVTYGPPAVAHANIQEPVENDLGIGRPWLCDSEGPGSRPGALLLAPRTARQAAHYCCPRGGTTVRNSAEDLRAARLTPGLAVRR